jgi:hypothetical protein
MLRSQLHGVSVLECKSVPVASMKYKDRVLARYPSAFCVQNTGLYSVVKPSGKESLLAHQSLSSPHITEELAWRFAAVRVRLEERTHAGMERNRALVLKNYSSAYCADLSGGYYQIRRPRLPDDKPSNLTYMPLSGRFSKEIFAWQHAAERTATLVPKMNNSRAQAS